MDGSRCMESTIEGLQHYGWKEREPAADLDATLSVWLCDFADGDHHGAAELELKTRVRILQETRVRILSLITSTELITSFHKEVIPASGGAHNIADVRKGLWVCSSGRTHRLLFGSFPSPFRNPLPCPSLPPLSDGFHSSGPCCSLLSK